MKREWLEWINVSIALTAGILLLGTLVIAFNRPATIPVLESSKGLQAIQDSAFKQPQASYEAIGQRVVALKASRRKAQLPDLKRFLVYHGKNNRPDADPNNGAMHFSFAGGKAASEVSPRKNFYLIYDKTQNPRYSFSPQNKETSLWIEAIPQGKEVIIKVGMQNEQGEQLLEPATNATFTLAEKPMPKTDAPGWEIGKFRVDGTLLARQKARWYGLDCFFERHGGKEFLSCLGKHRIDFGEGPDLYSVFIQLGDLLLWKNDQWTLKGDENSLNQPILVATKIDERLITFELWDAEGKGKTTLNLLKSTEPIIPPNVIQSLKFVGAKTRSQFVFEYNKERLILRPNDWLLFVDKKVTLLNSIEDIDAYVERKTTGFLLTFDAIEKRDDRPVFIGTLFNRARTAWQPVEILMQPGEAAAVKPAGAATSKVAGAAATSALRSQAAMQKPPTPAYNDFDDDDDDDDEDDDDDDDDPREPVTPRGTTGRQQPQHV